MTDSSSRRGARGSKPDKVQLTPDDWLDAAAEAIAEGGFDNVRVLVLAKKLGVTRGSFYWHFRDHQDLIVSFLERWRQRRLGELAYWRPTEGDVPAELRRKMYALLSEPARNMRRLKVELAVRDFARRDERTAQIVAEVDQARIDQNVRVLEDLIGESARIRDLSLLLYVATVGAQLVLTGPLGEDETLPRVEQLITDIVAQWHGITEGASSDAPAPSVLPPKPE